MGNIVRDVFIGLAVADAIGVPVEFTPRVKLKENPVTDMTGFGTYNQSPGTWSDDSSLSFCLAESLLNGYDLFDISQKFIDWKYKAIWTPHGKVFDIGITTSKAITVLRKLVANKDYKSLLFLQNSKDERSNGNGSLMRISPLYFYIKDENISKQFEIIRQVSSLTHGHIRSSIACFLYIRIMDLLIKGHDKRDAYINSCKEVKQFIVSYGISRYEQDIFSRVLDNDISKLNESDIRSDGYVIHSLEASLWCVLNTTNYKECVLKAVNLGSDTDTTAAIAGALAGIIYGEKDIPENWKKKLVKYDEIIQLADKLHKAYLT